MSSPPQGPDRVDALRAELSEVGALPVAERADVLDRACDVLVTELKALDEV